MQPLSEATFDDCLCCRLQLRVLRRYEEKSSFGNMLKLKPLTLLFPPIRMYVHSVPIESELPLLQSHSFRERFYRIGCRRTICKAINISHLLSEYFYETELPVTISVVSGSMRQHHATKRRLASWNQVSHEAILARILQTKQEIQSDH